jgi:hypothetical protein
VKTLPTSALKAWTGTDASVADIVIEHREGSFLPPSEVHIFTAAAALEAAGGGNPVYTDYDIFPEELKYYNDIRAAEEGFLLAERLRELFGEEDLGTELEFVIMVIAVSCVKLLSAHNSTQHTSRKHKV